MAKQSLIFGIASARETGKTDYVKNMAKTFIKNHPDKKCLIIAEEDSEPLRTLKTWDDPDNHKPIPIINIVDIPRWELGEIMASERILRTADIDIDRTFNIAAQFFYNGMIFFEDATNYILNGKISKDQRRTILHSKQHGCHLVFVFHYLQNIPAELARSLNVLVLGKTGEAYSNDIKKRFIHQFIRPVMEKVANSTDPYIKEEMYVGAN